MHETRREVGFVKTVGRMCDRRLHTRRTIRQLTCIRLHRDNGYLSQQSLATILVGGYAGHVGDVLLAAVQRSSAPTLNAQAFCPTSCTAGEVSTAHATIDRRRPRIR